MFFFFEVQSHFVLSELKDQLLNFHEGVVSSTLIQTFLKVKLIKSFLFLYIFLQNLPQIQQCRQRHHFLTP